MKWRCTAIFDDGIRVFSGDTERVENINLLNQLDILRRIAERGMRQCHAHGGDDLKYVDLFQHLLNEIELTRKCL